MITSAPRDLLALGAGEAAEEVLASGLDESIASVRRRTARLAYLIIRRDYMQAWCEACDLRRAIDQAEVLAFAVLELPESSEAVQRLDDVRDDAESVLELAPAPSSEAIRRAFAPVPHADRTVWDREVAEWIAKLAAHKPPAIATAASRPDATEKRPATRPPAHRNVAGDR